MSSWTGAAFAFVWPMGLLALLTIMAFASRSAVPLAGLALVPVLLFVGVLRGGGCLKAGVGVLGLVVAIVALGLWNAFAGPHDVDRYARATSDMRGLAVGIESFVANHGARPPWTMDPAKGTVADSEARMPSFLDHVPGSATLTTPVAYVAECPEDPFSPKRAQSTFAYWAPNETDWILVSPGPDRTFDLTWNALQRIYDSRNTSPTLLLIPYSYDPTNGIRSGGDIWQTRTRHSPEHVDRYGPLSSAADVSR